MIGYEVSGNPETLLRFIKTLGQHRYVASRLHLVHAFTLESVAGEGGEWARRALSGPVDLASKDERLWRRATDAELLAALGAFWGTDGAAREKLRERLSAIEALPGDALPFDEAREEDMFPVLIDAGWELLPLAHLDFERHRGAIQALSDYEVARFEEENAIPSRSTLHELPVFGGTELLAAFEGEELRAPFVLWQQGHDEYLDYVLRGILRASKIEDYGR